MESLVESIGEARVELEREPSRERVLKVLETFEKLTEASYPPSAYGSLWFSEDTQSEAALTFKNRIDRALVDFHNRVLFFLLWWKGLDEVTARELQPGQLEHADFRHFLEDLRRTKPFMLEERSEQIVNLKDTNGISAVLTIYSMLTNRLAFELEVDGEARSLTRDELQAYVYSPAADLRAAAYREMLRVFEGEAKVLGQIYVSRVLDWHAENVSLRGFSTPISVRNVDNDVPDEAVEALLDTCARNAPLFQRYFRWKARELGQERLSRFDLYAPLIGTDKSTPYSEAVELVLSTFEEFEPRLAALARRVFDDDHIDSEIRKGKKGGAFCATVLPTQTPWVQLNYTGKVRDVATLAHELGHAVHSMLAEDHSVLTQHPSLPLAETASVFAERLLVDRLLASETAQGVRRELLALSLDDIYATVMRQAYFVRFEQRAHAAILAGEPPEKLNEIYLGLLEEQFGDAVEVPQEFSREWVSIPHIYHTPFYCYAYSFGQLLVLALYRRFREQGASFVPGYLRLLAWGGASRPAEILAEAGVEMTDPSFWQGGFDVVEGLVDELEAL
ncbi:MAG: M3 family oligoendopeptidase [bacterium]|nr:M3 family oligoendopeptidase [bacterium]